MNRSTLPDVPPIRRILVATDFSSQSGHALAWAHEFAARFGAKLVLFHVIDIFTVAEMGCVVGGFDPLRLLREQARDCMNDLKNIIPDAEIVVREASPRPTIVAAAPRAALPDDRDGHARAFRAGASSAGQCRRICRQTQRCTGDDGQERANVDSPVLIVP
jgi:Universal stress protein family